MKTRKDRPSRSLAVEIVDVLDTCGIDPDAYTLHDYIDVDALEQLVASGSEDLEVEITIEGIQLLITRDDVRVLE